MLESGRCERGIELAENDRDRRRFRTHLPGMLRVVLSDANDFPGIGNRCFQLNV